MIKKIYEPTVFENYVQEIMVDGQSVELSLWDTAGQEEFDKIRLLSYEDTHVFMLCFSVENRDSLQNIQDKWLEEVLEHSVYSKIVLVALKCDLRQEKRNTILYEEVQAKKISFNFSHLTSVSTLLRVWRWQKTLMLYDI